VLGGPCVFGFAVFPKCACAHVCCFCGWKQIQDVVNCAPYRVEDSRYSVALMLQIGNSKPRQFSFKYVSNQKPTQKEMDVWLAILAKLQCVPPTAAWCSRRAVEMVSIRRNFRYSIEDVKALASKRSQDLRKVRSLVVLKGQLEHRVQALQDRIQELKDKDGSVDEELEAR
jgi:hypothetical protein